MKFEVKAQSNDAIIMTVEADDLFDAACIVGDKMNVEIVVSNNRSTTFEDDNDYYDLRQVS